MKKYYLILALLSINLSACGQNDASLTTVSTPQAVENFSKSATNSQTSNETQIPSTTSTTEENNEADSTKSTPKTFETQQDFVDYMYTKVTALEDTVALLDSNLSQIFSVIGTDDESSYQGIRESLFKQMTNESTLIENLLLPNTEVENLQQYVIDAYKYTVEAKQAEYTIYQAETLEERQKLLDANAENERLSALYIQKAWDELDRLSAQTIYRK